MKVTSTEFRQNLFQLVERALQGEFIEVAHKGRVVRLVPAEKQSKLSRLVPRDTICGSLDDLEKAQQELDAEMRASWDEKLAPRPFPSWIGRTYWPPRW